MAEMADYWSWMIAAAVFFILEILTPGIFFIWIGIAAFLTGMVDYVRPETSPEILGMVFAVLAVISACIGRKVMKKKQDAPTTLNNRAEQYVGQVFQVFEGVKDGRGKIKVGDTLWTALSSHDIRANTPVKVVGVRGTSLEIEPVDEA